MVKSQLKANKKYRFCIVSCDIVDSSRLHEDGDSQIYIKKTKENLKDFFRCQLNRFGVYFHGSGDGFIALFYIDDLEKDVDTSVAALIDLLRGLEIFNSNPIIGNLLSIAVRIRLVAHIGELVFSKKLDDISGEALNITAKREKMIGLPNHLSITKELFRAIVSKEIKRHFMPRKKPLPEEITSLLEIYDFKPEGRDIPLYSAYRLMKDTLLKFRKSLRGIILKKKEKVAKAGLPVVTVGEMNIPRAIPSRNEDLQMAKFIQMDMFEDEDLDDPWVDEAKSAVRQTMSSAKWNLGDHSVEIDDMEGNSSSYETLKKLQAALVEISNQAFYAYVPFESGEAVFEDTSEDWVYEILEEYAPQFKKLKWNISDYCLPKEKKSRRTSG